MNADKKIIQRLEEMMDSLVRENRALFNENEKLERTQTLLFFALSVAIFWLVYMASR